MESSIVNFSLFELRIVHSMISKCSAADISAILDRTTEEVAMVINDISEKNKIIPYDIALQQSVLAEKEKMLQHQQLVDENKEQKRKASSRNKEILRQQKQQEQSLKEHASHKRQSYTPPRRKEKMFATKTMDYSRLVAIHIDDNHHTTIYAKPGEDIADCKARYLDQLEKKKKVVFASLRTTTVKKFKPIS
jgi:hypothetical protein